MVAPQPFFRPRGTPFSVLHRIRALLGLGHTVDLVTYPFGEDPELDGLTLHRSARPPGVDDVPIGPSVRKLFLDLALFRRAWKLAATGEFDLIHTHEEAGVLGALVSRRHGIPHLYDMHSSLPQQFGNFGRYDWWPVVKAFEVAERYTLAAADGVIAICPDLEERVEASGYDGALALIENTMDVEAPDVGPDDARALRDRLGLGGGPAVVYTGTLEPYQGLDVLIEAAESVRERVPGTRFVLVGGDGERIAELEEMARRAGAAGAFTFVPRVPPEEVFLYHAIADVLVTTRTRGTNTPLKIYQYLRAPAPIVATDIESHTQVLDRGCAELVAPSPRSVAQGLVRVLTDPERARSLTEAASRLAEERYGEEEYLRRLASLLDRLPQRARRTVPAAVG